MAVCVGAFNDKLVWRSRAPQVRIALDGFKWLGCD
jgi:hypothetical protein